VKQSVRITNRDLWALLLVMAIFFLVADSFKTMDMKITPEIHAPISLDIENLPRYILQTTMRLLIGIVISVIFAIIYATIAAKNATLEKILVPLLDILQSVPVLGYISFTVTGFINLFAGSTLGVECAVIFAIFSAQVWNITISIYQSLKSLPKELAEVSMAYNLNKVQKYFKVELPFAIPGIVWNIIVSMSGAWFFIVASEVIAVGEQKFFLPGVGSYIDAAIKQEDLRSISYAILGMLVSIIVYDQILLRPLTDWAAKFRYETSNTNFIRNSWCYNLLKSSIIVPKFFSLLSKIFNFIVNLRFFDSFEQKLEFPNFQAQKVKDYLLVSVVLAFTSYHLYDAWGYLNQEITMKNILECIYLTSITLVRIICMLALATIIWVPIGIYVGLNSRNAAKAQLISQILAAFPTNLLFPLFVVFIHNYFLDPNIWLSFLIIFGAQWYILFNTIAGSSAIPNEFREVYKSLDIKGLLLFKKIILPSIFPQFLSGAFAAWGGAWNATIVAEFVEWGHVEYKATGIGSYIAEVTETGDLIKVALGICTMTFFVITLNKFFWDPIFKFSEEKFRLE
jgi:NitT/TauT family transport system permease protein